MLTVLCKTRQKAWEGTFSLWTPRMSELEKAVLVLVMFSINIHEGRATGTGWRNLNSRSSSRMRFLASWRWVSFFSQQFMHCPLHSYYHLDTFFRADLKVTLFQDPEVSSENLSAGLNPHHGGQLRSSPLSSFPCFMNSKSIKEKLLPQRQKHKFQKCWFFSEKSLRLYSGNDGRVDGKYTLTSPGA